MNSMIVVHGIPIWLDYMDRIIKSLGVLIAQDMQISFTAYITLTNIEMEADSLPIFTIIWFLIVWNATA